MKVFAIATVLFMAIRCNVDPEPVKDPDSAGSSEDCPAMCENLERLGCESAKGSPGEDELYGTADDISCLDVCTGIMEEAVVSIHPNCIAEIESCDEEEACFE